MLLLRHNVLLNRAAASAAAPFAFPCRELLGSHLHFEVLQGTAAIEQAAADEEAAAPSGGAAAGAGGDGRKKVKWARQRPAVLLPWGTGEQASRATPPLISPLLPACSLAPHMRGSSGNIFHQREHLA